MTERDEKVVVLAFLACVGILAAGVLAGYILGLIFH
jgi:hypothetical protein